IFEPVLASIHELDLGAGDEILDGAGNEYLAGFREGRDTRTDVHGDTARLAVDHLTLTGVQSRPHFEAELAHTLADRTGAVDRPRGAVEGCEEAVACGVHLLAPEP